MARTANDVHREARAWGDPDGVNELIEEHERVLSELEDERVARLLVDNRVAELEEAIRNHRRQIRAHVPAKSGTAADEALWWWVQ